MNERIKELFKQAGGHTSVRNLASNPVQVVETHELWDDRIEKFAELIVAECIEVFSKDMPDPLSPDYKLGSLDEVVKRVCAVAEHFGVD